MATAGTIRADSGNGPAAALFGLDLDEAHDDVDAAARRFAYRGRRAGVGEDKLTTTLTELLENIGTPDPAKRASTAVALSRMGPDANFYEREERLAIQEESDGARDNGHCSEDWGSRFKLLTDADLEKEADRADLIKDVIPAASLTVIAGAPASGKSTLGIEMAGDVGNDLLFHGRAVTPGPVVIIAAEGSPAKLSLRVRAWKACRKIESMPRVYFLPEPVQLGNAGDVDALLVSLGKLPEPPVLVVVDTLARCMIGADENSAQAVGAFVQGCDRLRRETGAAVLVVHHTNKAGTAERGSGALRAAADTLAIVTREDDLITVTCDKQKDGAPFEPLHFRLRVIELGNERTACVLDPVEKPQRVSDDAEPAKLPESRRKALEALQDAAAGATYSQWLKLAEQGHRMSEPTFQRALKDLLQWGRIEKRGERYFAREAS